MEKLKWEKSFMTVAKIFGGYIQLSPSKKKDTIDWTDSKFTTFCFLKDIIKMKSQATDWEKILQIYM